MKKLVTIMAALLSLLAVAAWAGPITTFVWDPPTQYTDGTTIPPGGISGYRMYCGTTPSPPFSLVTTLTPTTMSAISSVVTATAAGSYYCHITSLTPDGSESNPSNQVQVIRVAGESPGFTSPGSVPRPLSTFRAR